jgi:DNA-binding LytR/AlgR family response regulator
MIRVAILEYEKETKDIVFELAQLFSSADWMFRHYWKASVLAKACQEQPFQIFFFDEMFKSPRLESVFVHDNPNALFIYVCKNVAEVRDGDERSRIFYIDKAHIKEDLHKIGPEILSQASQTEIYPLSYGGVKVNLPYEEIYYLEKVDKMVYFHTKKGEFHQRINMAEMEERLSNYGFLRVHVSYLVNSKHITRWYKDEVEISNGERIPVSRSQKRRMNAQRKADKIA